MLILFRLTFEHRDIVISHYFKPPMHLLNIIHFCAISAKVTDVNAHKRALNPVPKAFLVFLLSAPERERQKVLATRFARAQCKNNCYFSLNHQSSILVTFYLLSFVDPINPFHLKFHLILYSFEDFLLYTFLVNRACIKFLLLKH